MVQQAPPGGPPPGSGYPGPGGPVRPQPTQRATRWVWSLVGALVAAGAVLALVRTFIQGSAGLWADEIAFAGSVRGRAQLEPISHLVLGVVGVPFLIGAILVAVAVALARRQWGDAARAAAIVVGANVTTQVLKELLERPDVPGMQNLANSFPSGHTTVAASVAAVALLVAPRGARPLVAVLGATYAAATAVATMSLGWHRPSDVIAAFAVVTAWTLLLMVPGSGRLADGFPGTGGRVAASLLLAVVAVVGIGAGAVTLGLTLAGVDLAGGGDVLAATGEGTQTMAYVGSAAAVVGCAAAASWAQLLARR